MLIRHHGVGRYASCSRQAWTAQRAQLLRGRPVTPIWSPPLPNRCRRQTIGAIALALIPLFQWTGYETCTNTTDLKTCGDKLHCVHYH